MTLVLASVVTYAVTSFAASPPEEPGAQQFEGATRALESEVAAGERTQPAGDEQPAGKQMSDAEIESRLETVFGFVEEFSEVAVGVRSGVVQLRGTVLSKAEQTHAAELAASVEGVVYVDNDLEVSTSVSERVEPVWETATARTRDFVRKLPLLAIALAVFVPFALLARLMSAWQAPYRLVTKTPLLQGIVRRIVASAIVVAGAIAAFEILDATALVGAVLGTAGVFGVALGFAFRDIVENYLASVMLGIRRPFNVHDHVLIDEFEGKVVRLTTRETILMTLDGNHLRLPNAQVFKAVIVNYARNPLRRFDFIVGAGVDEDLAAAQQLGVSTLHGMPGVVGEPPPFSWVEELGDSNVAIRFFGWVDQRNTDIYKARSEAIRRVKVALDEAGIDLPEPIYRVRLERRGGAGAPPQRPRPTMKVETPAHEVEADAHIDRQIEEDLSEDPNSLI